METLQIPQLAYFQEQLTRRMLPLRGDAFPPLGSPRTTGSLTITMPPGAATDISALAPVLIDTIPHSPVLAAALADNIRKAEAMQTLFSGLVREYGTSLYYFVLKRVKHPDDAADIAQQAFVEAACSITSYRGEAELSTWIFGIAINLARNHISRAPQHRHRFESDEVLESCSSPELQPCESLSQRQGLKLVSEAMNLLPPEMANALNLVAVEDMSYEEAAAELQVPIGTVRSRVSRARAAVRKHLRGAGYIDPAVA
ncbi:MAG: RNA polymerase sigma factor [Polaromonas sp.]|nr:RNA polymerase sigma factor [Polaromonas sp.]